MFVSCKHWLEDNSSVIYFSIESQNFSSFLLLFGSVV